MHYAREQLLFLISTPIYAVVIGAEMLASAWLKRGYYSARGTLMNVLLSALNFGLDILMLGICLGVLSRFERPPLIENPALYWAALFVALDFMFYLLHFVDHHCRLFWAVHVTHHSSEEFNLTVGFRSSVFQPLYRFVYFIPLAMAGFRPMDAVFVYAVSQIYGILIHTQFVGHLGFLEWFMATPSHHRVHHGANVRYLDRNMGMLLIVWDRLFGTFEPERESVRYGLTKPLDRPADPLQVIFHEWRAICGDVKRASSWTERFMYVFGPPGWSPDGSRKTSRQMREGMAA